jgi:hypothetical protein
MRPDLLDELVAELDPALVPPEFIIRATYQTRDGVEHTVDGNALANMLREGGGVLRGVHDARVTIDVRAIKQAMMADVVACYERVNRLIKARHANRAARD